MERINSSTMRGRPLEASKTLIVVKSQFEGIHSWPDCPYDDVSFLRHPHRHIFHVTLKMEVTHDDRELEFIQVKRILEDLLSRNYNRKNLYNLSCEMMSKNIGMHFIGMGLKVHVVSVFEDNENGAEVYFS